jgi:hypothetical protein
VQTFIRKGERMWQSMHDASHNGPFGAHGLPTLVELDLWRDDAAQMTMAVYVFDQDWYFDYWRRVIEGGYSLSRGLRSMLLRLGVMVR